MQESSEGNGGEGPRGAESLRFLPQLVSQRWVLGLRVALAP